MTRPVPPYAWVILALIYMASLAAPLNQFKVPPVMGELMAGYGLSLSAAGLLMGVFALIGVVLSLPSGFIMGRIGVKNAGLAALLFLMAGSALGATARTAGVLMFSRVLEGVGLCLMSIVAPTALAAWFPPHKHGLAMGLWGTWVPMGSILAFAVFPSLAARGGWPGAAWASFGYTAVAALLFLLLFRLPPAAGPAPEKPGFGPEWTAMKGVLGRRDPWFLALSFGGYMILTISLITYLPTFFARERGLTPEEAGFAASLYLIVNMIGIFLGGMLSDKIGPRRCLTVAYAGAALLMPFFFAPGQAVYAVMIAVAFIGAFGVTPSFAAAPQLAKPEDAGRALSLLALGQNAGMCLGPPLFGKIVEGSGWSAAGYAVIPVLLAAAFLASRLKIR